MLALPLDACAGLDRVPNRSSSHRRPSGALRRARRRRRVLVVALLLELATVTWAMTRALQVRYTSPPNIGVVPGVTAVAAPVRVRPMPHRPTQASSPPTRLALPALAVDATIVPVGINGAGALAVPPDIHAVGWWTQGALPGSSAGTVVIDGHVDSSQGHGALFAVGRLALGDQISVSTRLGTRYTYLVAARRTYIKARLPESIFVTSGQPRLVLITCGGQFDPATRHYDSNVVVYAVPEV